MVVVVTAPPIAARGDAAAAPRKQSTVRMVKEALVAAAGLQALHQDLLSDSKVVERMSTIMWMVWLLDESRDPEADDALVALLSYNLGTAANENVSCILQDRGAVVRPKLAALLLSRASECRTRLKDFPGSALRAACISEQSMKASVGGLISAIDRKEACPLR
jgi:hypothetical protein